MTETRADYTTINTINSVKFVSCQQCGKPIGSLTIEPAGAYLMVGNMRLKSVYGSCSNCGQEFHWVAESVRLERLLKK